MTKVPFAEKLSEYISREKKNIVCESITIIFPHFEQFIETN